MSNQPTNLPKIELPGIKSVLAVASGKGGVGKSTVSANLAMALSMQGAAVGLLDADIYGPSIPLMFGVNEIIDQANTPFPLVRHGIKLMSMGFLVPPEKAVIWRGPMIHRALTQFLTLIPWGELDYLVIDLPPGTGDVQLTLAQQTPLSGAVIVSTPQDLALIDARKGLNMFRKVNVPVIGIVENMSYFVCTKCGERHEIFGHGGAREEAERIGVPFLGEIPLDREVRLRSDSGEPVVATQSGSLHAAIYRDVAHQVWAALEKGGLARPAPRIVME